jgi:enterochelin esterase-like enzyme
MMAGGKIESAVISSDIARKLVDIRVYTPPCYNPAAGKEYPVLYLLHGQSSREDQWDLLGVDEAASDLIRAGKIEPLIIVMPREINYLDDPSNSNFGDLILSEVIPWAEKNYAIHPDSGMHAIGGLSRGGSWALRLGLSNPDLFGSVAGHSPVPFTADLYQVSNWRVKTAEEQLPYIYLDIGLLDPYKDIARRYELRISEVAYPHEWHMNEGTHNSEYWSGNVKDYLIWYNNGWRLTQGGE